MGFNATYNNISAISWWLDLLVTTFVGVFFWVSSTNKTEILLKVAFKHHKTKPSINYRRLPTKYIWFSNSIYDYIRIVEETQKKTPTNVVHLALVKV
jgi:hypothetical protein